MAGIKSKNTRPELLLRRALHKRGFRYSLHSKRIPGRPDLVLPSYNAVIFVHGCFWHGHNCNYFKLPGTRTAFWKGKIESNRKRDREVRNKLKSEGWRQLVVWECVTRGTSAEDIDRLTTNVARWLRSRRNYLAIRN